MTQFNPELITKARKGEIAILNDGTLEELNKILNEAWPGENMDVAGDWKYYKRHSRTYDYPVGTNVTNLPAYSVKEFFMPDTTINHGDLNGTNETVVADSPRTYRVTRQQMKEIYDSMPDPNSKGVIIVILNEVFTDWENEAKITDSEINEIIRWLGAPTELLKSTFPEYFHIPAGEPVLVRDSDEESWKAAISDGKGGVQREVGGPSFEYIQIIPFTKNPPK